MSQQEIQAIKDRALDEYLDSTDPKAFEKYMEILNKLEALKRN